MPTKTCIVKRGRTAKTVTPSTARRINRTSAVEAVRRSLASAPIFRACRARGADRGRSVGYLCGSVIARTSLSHVDSWCDGAGSTRAVHEVDERDHGHPKRLGIEPYGSITTDQLFRSSYVPSFNQ